MHNDVFGNDNNMVMAMMPYDMMDAMAMMIMDPWQAQNAEEASGASRSGHR